MDLLQSITILIVEDEHDVRVMLRMALELEGYRIVSAADGRQALELLLNQVCTPDLIILDLMMPVVNGWEVLESLRKHPELKSIPVLVTSATGNRSKVTDVLEFIPKPIDLDRFIDAVTAIRSPRLRPSAFSEPRSSKRPPPGPGQQ